LKEVISKRNIRLNCYLEKLLQKAKDEESKDQNVKIGDISECISQIIQLISSFS